MVGYGVKVLGTNASYQAKAGVGSSFCWQSSVNELIFNQSSVPWTLRFSTDCIRVDKPESSHCNFPT